MRFIKKGQEGQTRYMFCNGYKPTLVDAPKNDSRVRLNRRCKVYVMEETHVYVILDIDQLYMNYSYI